MQVTIGMYGGVVIDATGADTYDWSHRPGSAWPCSELSGNAVVISLADNGDLIDLEGVEDCGGDELTAFADDALTNAGNHLLEIRRNPIVA